ncbi:MAG: hypothetical protein ABH951_02505 [Patescibacteria group bacterium]
MEEKDFFKKRLEGLDKPKDIEEFVKEARSFGYEDLVEIAEQKLQELSDKAESVGETSKSKIEQVKSMGGNQDELEAITADVDKKIKETTADFSDQINEVGSQNTENVEINRDLYKIGSIFDLRARGSGVIKVEIISDIQKTDEKHPREYVRVKSTQGNLETDVELDKLMEKFDLGHPVKNKLAEQERDKNYFDKISSEKNIMYLGRIKESLNFNSLVEAAQETERLFEIFKDNIGLKETDLKFISAKENYDKQKKVFENLMNKIKTDMKISSKDFVLQLSPVNIVNIDQYVKNTQEHVKKLNDPEVQKSNIEEKFKRFELKKERAIKESGEDAKKAFEMYEDYMKSGEQYINNYIEKTLGLSDQSSPEFKIARGTLIKAGDYYRDFVENQHMTESAEEKFPKYSEYKKDIDFMSV